MSLQRQTDPISNPAANNLLLLMQLFTPDNENRRPSNVNVITQDSGHHQLKQQWDFYSASSVRVACNNFQTHQHFHNEDWLLYNQHTASTAEASSPLLDEPPSNIPQVRPTPTTNESYSCHYKIFNSKYYMVDSRSTSSIVKNREIASTARSMVVFLLIECRTQK